MEVERKFIYSTRVISKRILENVKSVYVRALADWKVEEGNAVGVVYIKDYCYWIQHWQPAERLLRELSWIDLGMECKGSTALGDRAKGQLVSPSSWSLLPLSLLFSSSSSMYDCWQLTGWMACLVVTLVQLCPLTTDVAADVSLLAFSSSHCFIFSRMKSKQNCISVKNIINLLAATVSICWQSLWYQVTWKHFADGNK